MNITARFVEYRVYGQPKLKKPKCLKGLDVAWKHRIIGKEAKVYELPDGALVVYLGELFCKQTTFPERIDGMLPASVLQKKYPHMFERRGFKSFVYPDAWCTFFDRNDGYVRIDGVREAVKECLTPMSGVQLGPCMAELSRAFAELSKESAGFNHLEWTDGEFAPYARVLDDIIGHYFVAARDERDRQFKERLG